MRLIPLLLALLLGPGVARATGSDDLLARGIQRFDAGQFEAALLLFDEAARAAPTDERPVWWSGKAAGRLAEQAGPLRAYQLARRTLRDFEKAHALNPRNVDVIDDLIEFHDKAPRFMGGSPVMARQLRERRAALLGATSP